MADSKDTKTPHDAAPPAAALHQYTMVGNDVPPPPPGPPPPSEQQQQMPPRPQQPQEYQQHQQHQHTNELPIPEYNPAHPQLAPPPADLQQQQDELSDDERRRAKSKAWSSKLHHLGAKAAGPINALANKMGSQAFLPTTMDKECEKAAAILMSFCKEGVYSEDHRPKTPTTPTTPEGGRRTKSRSRERALVTIPRKVITNAVGLAIFTTARAGFQISAATGSGVLVARLPDGSWSPPSGIQVHSLGAGFMVGVDIYDCVCVINTREALGAFMHTRVSLGPDVAIAAGPYGIGGGVDFGAGSGPPHRDRVAAAEAEKKAKEDSSLSPKVPVQQQQQQQQQEPVPVIETPAGDGEPSDDGKLKPEGKKSHRRSGSNQFGPVFSYVKSRGFYAGIQVDGTVITERKEANAAFYGEPVPVEKILQGAVVGRQDAHAWPSGAKVLVEALKRAEESMRPGQDAVVIPSAGQTSAPAMPVSQASPDDGQPPPYGNHGQAYPGTGDQKTTYQ